MLDSLNGLAIFFILSVMCTCMSEILLSDRPAGIRTHVIRDIACSVIRNIMTLQEL